MQKSLHSKEILRIYSHQSHRCYIYLTITPSKREIRLRTQASIVSYWIVRSPPRFNHKVRRSILLHSNEILQPRRWHGYEVGGFCFHENNLSEEYVNPRPHSHSTSYIICLANQTPKRQKTTFYGLDYNWVCKERQVKALALRFSGLFLDEKIFRPVTSAQSHPPVDFREWYQGCLFTWIIKCEEVGSCISNLYSRFPFSNGDFSIHTSGGRFFCS